ncbi:MAG: hypothetical protein ACI9OJ_004300 [Myxococcota bacterium]|jgi:hypothetical protein
MTTNRPLLLMLTGAALLCFVMLASAQTKREPPTPSVEAAKQTVLAGLKLIEAKDFEGWISQYCHPEHLCPTETSKKSLKRYNLPAIQRLAKKCINGGKLRVKRAKRDDSLGRIKLYVVCDPKGMPRPFSLRKHGADWKFERI